MDYRERLERVAARQTVTLTHYGRKSGKPYQVTIWFVAHAGKVYIGTADVNRNWVHNVKHTPGVRLNIGGEVFDGVARFLDGAERDRAMALVRRKYWMYLPVVALGSLLIKMKILKFTQGAFEVILAEAGNETST